MPVVLLAGMIVASTAARASGRPRRPPSQPRQPAPGGTYPCGRHTGSEAPAAGPGYRRLRPPRLPQSLSPSPSQTPAARPRCGDSGRRGSGASRTCKAGAQAWKPAPKPEAKPEPKPEPKPLMPKVRDARGQEVSLAVLAHPATAERFKLTEAQRTQIAALVADREATVGKIPAAQRAAKLEEAEQKIAAVLTEAQRADFVKEPPEPLLKFHFRYQRWIDVLKEVARQAGLSLSIGELRPPARSTTPATRNTRPPRRSTCSTAC